MPGFGTEGESKILKKLADVLYGWPISSNEADLTEKKHSMGTEVISFDESAFPLRGSLTLLPVRTVLDWNIVYNIFQKGVIQILGLGSQHSHHFVRGGNLSCALIRP